jgi:DNA helicase-2/ATP-dependent DNA helicase PcrA
MANDLTKKLWKEKKFAPNDGQKQAILFDEDKPMFITAAPGAGKTRVLLWRAVHLIVDRNVLPEEIFLSTFTEKAAHQLKEGLKELLGLAANYTNKKYDLARMYVGTIHSNCHRILLDRKFSDSSERQIPPRILDELGQYLYIYNYRFWSSMLESVGLENNPDTHRIINAYLGTPQQARSGSRHTAVVNVISLFNRLSEELVKLSELQSENSLLDQLYKMYCYYIESLKSSQVIHTDLSLLQADALRLVEKSDNKHFRHVIIDEYQDTNYVQERLVFALARFNKNLCVVGDDDQALYRFRGATVENFVNFPDRCQKYYSISPEKISLHTNYRSLQNIVEISQSFMSKTNWNEDGRSYRIFKNVNAHRSNTMPAVFMTDAAGPGDVTPQMARFIRGLKENGVVNDYNEIAILFSYLKGNAQVERLSQALEEEGIRVYAPRARCFLDLDEALVVFGLFAKIIGRPALQGLGRDLGHFRDWLDRSIAAGFEQMQKDSALRLFVDNKQKEIAQNSGDYKRLVDYCERHSLRLDTKITAPVLIEMTKITGLSKDVVNKLSSGRLLFMIEQDHPKATISYMLNRVTSLDWGLLDLFYQLTTFEYFRNLIELASSGQDEGPMCNLGLITQYISRYQEERGRPILTARDFHDNRIQRHFFASYLFAMYRLGESEFEDKEDPFPKGRVSIITIHQAKGLEFPVVILGGLYRQNRGPGTIEEIVRNELNRDGEPLDRIVDFDNARLFYVALSRAQNILLLPRFSGRGQRMTQEFRELLDENIQHLGTIEWDKAERPKPKETDEIGRPYSYTSDYLLYKRCPRQYMMFRKYGFVPARAQVTLFGSLVHQTIEDLHNFLLLNKG